MTCRTITDVTNVLEMFKTFNDRIDLDELAVQLPHLRRPRRGREGEWDVARYLALPPAFRAASVFWTFRAEINNGGVDQFVYNQIAILAQTIDAFIHIGADGAASTLLELGGELVADPEFFDVEGVEGFLAFREATSFRWDTGDYGDVADLRDALVRFAKESPAEFVLRSIEERSWSNDGHQFRGTIFQRPDELHEVELHVHHASSWYEMARAPELFTLEEAREKLGEEMRAREKVPTTCDFEVSSCSKFEDGFRIWSKDALALDRLPLERSLRIRFSRGEETLFTHGRFVADVSDMHGRGYGHVAAAEVPPGATQWPPLDPPWNCFAEVDTESRQQ